MSHPETIALPAELDEPECERLAYPCDIAETPPRLLERTVDLINEAGARLAEEGMPAARAFLEEQPDVVEAMGSATATTFRVAGASQAWLLDISAGPSGQAVEARSAAYDDGARPPRARLASVVGKDTSGDGHVSNRDAKRALVLAPYHWQFSPVDESEYLAAGLATLPGYDEVRLRMNGSRSDQNVTIDDWTSWHRYDAIFVATHGDRECGVLDGKQVCRTVISTGIRAELADMMSVGGLYRGFIQIGIYAGMSNMDVELGATTGSFSKWYPDGLDDVFISLAACKTGLVPGDELAADMAPVAMIWC